MNELLPLLAQNAVLLVVGTTLLLSLGCAAVMLCKSPVHRQRISELAIAGVLGWMVLALFPLPRLLPESFFRAKPPVNVDANPVWPAELEAREPEDGSVAIVPPVTEIPMDGPADEESFAANSIRVDEIGIPSYESSPSEELPRATKDAPEPAQSAPVFWWFDSTKLAGLCTGAYLAGASLCLFWILAGHILLLRIRWTAEAPPEWLAKQYRSLAKKSGLSPPWLIVSRLCARPLTWGVFWPVVVLPHSLCRQENKSQLETILLHELGHIAQQDAQGNLLFCAVLPLLYAHPLYWWLRRESQLAAELVADDRAAQQTGKETYVEELVALARCTGTSSLPLVGVTGLFSSPSQFYRRMSMLLAREKPLSTRTSLPWRLASLSALAGAVALAASLAGVRPAAGQTESAENPPVAVPPATVPSLTPPTDLPAPILPPALSFPPGTELPQPVDPVAAPPAFQAVVPALGPIPLALDYPRDSAEAALLAEIKQLQDKLRALEGKRLHPKQLPTDKRAANNSAGRIVIAREDADGKVFTEIWTTDGKGQPDKIVSRTETGNAPVERAAIRTTESRDGKTIMQEQTAKDGSRSIVVMDAATGKIFATVPYPATGTKDSPDWQRIVKEVVDKDGVRRQYFLDALTGKVIESVPAPPKGEDTVEPRLTPPAQDPNNPQEPATPRPTISRRSELRFPTPILPGKAAPPAYDYGVPFARPSEPNLAAGGQQLDLVKLATSYADAVSEVELAEAKMADIAKLVESKTISQQEAVAAKLAFSAAQRKEQLLRSIAEVATASAAAEFERTTELHEKGAITAGPFQEAKTRMEILKQILRTRPESQKSDPDKAKRP